MRHYSTLIIAPRGDTWLGAKSGCWPLRPRLAAADRAAARRAVRIPLRLKRRSPPTMASGCAGTPCGGAAVPPPPRQGGGEQCPAGTMLAGRTNHGDCPRPTVIPVSVRQDRAVLME